MLHTLINTLSKQVFSKCRFQHRTAWYNSNVGQMQMSDMCRVCIKSKCITATATGCFGSMSHFRDNAWVSNIACVDILLQMCDDIICLLVTMLTIQELEYFVFGAQTSIYGEREDHPALNVHISTENTFYLIPKHNIA